MGQELGVPLCNGEERSKYLDGNDSDDVFDEHDDSSKASSIDSDTCYAIDKMIE